MSKLIVSEEGENIYPEWYVERTILLNDLSKNLAR